MCVHARMYTDAMQKAGGPVSLESVFGVDHAQNASLGKWPPDYLFDLREDDVWASSAPSQQNMAAAMGVNQQNAQSQAYFNYGHQQNQALSNKELHTWQMSQIQNAFRPEPSKLAIAKDYLKSRAEAHPEWRIKKHVNIESAINKRV